MKYKAILFDMDGVVIDSEKLYTRFWAEAANDLGYHVIQWDVDNLNFFFTLLF